MYDFKFIDGQYVTRIVCAESAVDAEIGNGLRQVRRDIVPQSSRPHFRIQFSTLFFTKVGGAGNCPEKKERSGRGYRQTAGVCDPGF